MIIPSIVSGPAIIQWNGLSLYSKDGIKKKLVRNTFNPVVDSAGKLGERLISQHCEISGTPVGQLQGTDLGKYFPYLVTDVGASIFSKAADDSVIIWTKAGQKITFHRGAPTKLSNLKLAAGATLFGSEMTFTCIGKADTQPTDAAAWKTISAAAFADTTFDQSKIITNVYQAAFGETPYDAIGAMDGFNFNVELETDMIMVDGYGVADITIGSLGASVNFAPSNLTEAQIDTLLAVQDADALLPGQEIAKSNTDLVITSDALNLTLYKCGAKDAEYEYQKGVHRFKGINFVAKRTWTAGAANPLYLIEIP